MKNKIDVQPDVIAWAVRRAGYTLESFAQSFPKVGGWIKRKKKPSIFELERFSYYIDIPFGYLLLKAPLEEKLPILFFKTDEGCINEVSLHVYHVILLMQGRQEWLRHYLKDNGSARHSYVGKFNLSSTPQEIVDDIRSTLGLTEYWARVFPTWKEAFDFLIEKIEEIGIVLVFSTSVKQDNFRPIATDECRGIALVDSFAPYVFVNMSDAKAAQMFTVMFGIAHIWVGQSAGFDFTRLYPANNPLELLCYKIAAEFLAPEATFYSAWKKREDIEKMTQLLRISPVIIAKRLTDIGKLSEFDFFKFYSDYINQSTVQREWTKSQGAIHAYKQRRVGKVLANHIKQAVRTNQLLYQDAYRLVKIKGNVYRKLLAQ